MKKLLLLLCCITTMQTMHAMQGALFGGAVPATAGLCYTVASSQPIDKKIKEWALATGCGVAAGGASQFIFDKIVENPTTAATVTAFTAGAIGCGIVTCWILDKSLPRFKK